MKIKVGFVTNSSSTAYIIANISDKPKDLIDFVYENPEIIEDYVEEYLWEDEDRTKYTQQMLLRSAKENNKKFEPGEAQYCIFGDEDRTLIGRVFEYMLRNGGSSKSFTWYFSESLR